MRERILSSSQEPLVKIVGRHDPVINLSSNNYLGLAVPINLLPGNGVVD
jgi:7-keto-8-aminopelargonate synthetase-like enzyme